MTEEKKLLKQCWELLETIRDNDNCTEFMDGCNVDELRNLTDTLGEIFSDSKKEVMDSGSPPGMFKAAITWTDCNDVEHNLELLQSSKLSEVESAFGFPGEYVALEKTEPTFNPHTAVVRLYSSDSEGCWKEVNQYDY